MSWVALFVTTIHLAFTSHLCVVNDKLNLADGDEAGGKQKFNKQKRLLTVSLLEPLMFK